MWYGTYTLGIPGLEGMAADTSPRPGARGLVSTGHRRGSGRLPTRRQPVARRGATGRSPGPAISSRPRAQPSADGRTEVADPRVPLARAAGLRLLGTGLDLGPQRSSHR